MNLLLDTHTFLWWAAEPAKLSPAADSALRDGANTLYLSVASIWELQIKLQLGKLTLSKPLPDFVQNQQHVNGCACLPLSQRIFMGSPLCLSTTKILLIA
ncbi:type II toxin-antitoxin system VapC family toxin [Kouleothrix sp.]|uniref:type II toxin-antitoxin system VapC family toxin n=1 Tax=Kouleothrix sp. TaxID=2779161 RepID=UPI003918E860